jgi:hypothetical protein
MTDKHPPRRPGGDCAPRNADARCPILLAATVSLADLEFLPVQEQRRTWGPRAALCHWLTWSVHADCARPRSARTRRA